MLNEPFTPMLLKKSDMVPVDPSYLHQFKWDGHRVSVHYDNGHIMLFTRELNNCTLQYPEFQSIRLPVQNCILDGECIVLDKDSNPPLPSFEAVMRRFSTKNERAIKRLINELPALLVVWDILYLNNKSLVNLKLEERLQILSEIVKPQPLISVTPSLVDGEMLFKNIVRIGGEGVVSKPREGKYIFGYATGRFAWLKTKNYQFTIVQIGGIRKHKFGWSLFENGKYVGVLEFAPALELRQAFFRIAKQIIREETRDWYIIEPIVKCKVKFQCYTKDGKLRSPSFVEFVF